MKQLTKPILLWLEDLPMPARERAINNMLSLNDHYMGSFYSHRMETAISAAFPWHRSKEGAEYWIRIKYKYA